MERIGHIMEIKGEKRKSPRAQIGNTGLDSCVEVEAVIESIDAHDGVGLTNKFWDEGLSWNRIVCFRTRKVGKIKRHKPRSKGFDREDPRPHKVPGPEAASRTDIDEHAPSQLVSVEAKVFPQSSVIDQELRRATPLIGGMKCELPFLSLASPLLHGSLMFGFVCHRPCSELHKGQSVREHKALRVCVPRHHGPQGIIVELT